MGEDHGVAAGTAHETHTAIAVLLAVAAVLAAAIGARGAVLGDEGSDKWHDAVRQEIKYGAGLLEDVRFVYNESAPQAFATISAQVRAQELDRQARRSPQQVRALLQSEAGAQKVLAAQIAKSSGIASDKAYSAAKASYDVPAALAASRRKHPQLVALDAAETQHEGSDLKRQSSLMFATAIPAAFAFLCGALAHGFGTWRRWLIPLGFVLCGVSFLLALIVEFSV